MEGQGLKKGGATNTKLDIGENEWLKNLPMSGENGAHMRHMKTSSKEKTSHPP